MKIPRRTFLAQALLAPLAAGALRARPSAGRQGARWCHPEEFFTAPPAPRALVSLVRCDDRRLHRPACPSDPIDPWQIKELVEMALKPLGGLASLLPRGARRVLLKPNVVEPAENGNGADTDWRVVRALVLLLYRLDPGLEITVGDGSGDYALPGTPDVPDWALEANGYEVSGYREMIEALRADPELPGLKLRWLDLNYDPAVEVPVPEPVLSPGQRSFWLPRAFLEADFVIDVPVLKVHSAGITVGMKNLVGLLPGLVYGWSKSDGYRGNGIRLDHDPRLLQQSIVDLARTVRPHLVVADCLTGKEVTKFRWGPSVQLGTIAVGTDLVAVDAVCARLMGFDPQDLEQLTLAHRAGLGRCDRAGIELAGGPPEELGRRFIRCGTTEAEQRHERYHFYGQGCRDWLVSAAVAADPARLDPHPGESGWSRPLYFFGNEIDPAAALGARTGAVRAFCRYAVPADGKAVLWVGSSGPLRVWLEGEPVYAYAGPSRPHLLPEALVPVTLRAGGGCLLAELPAGESFSLNLCDTEPDPRYAGSRPAGLEFRTA